VSDYFVIVNTNNHIFLVFFTRLGEADVEDILVSVPLATFKNALTIPTAIQTEVNHLATAVAFRQTAYVLGLRYHASECIKMSVEVNRNFFYFSC
jgi:hypothetical protein